MPIHLRADPGDYAPAVLCPGDPRRARAIAQRLFDPGARRVNEERGLLGFTGTFGGRPLSVQATGIGGPSAAIVFEELVQLGATRLIRVGTCGALQPTMQMADTVLALSATPHDTTALVYTGGDEHAPTATWSLVASAVALAEETGTALHIGPIVTSSVFYDPDPARITRWSERGHLAIEMETAVLYTLAALRGVEALALFTVSDVVVGDVRTRITDEHLDEGVDRMMTLACRVATTG